MDCWCRFHDCRWILYVNGLFRDGLLSRCSDHSNLPLVIWWIYPHLFGSGRNLTGLNSITLADSRGKDSLFKCFVTGFIMSITSPLSILFWLGIYGSVLAKTAQVNGTGMLLVYSSMIFLGLTLWDIFVAGLTTGLRRSLTLSSLRMISIFSGVSLIGFGLYFGYQGINALF